MLLAMDLQMQLEDEGCLVIGPAPNVARALEAISEQKPDAATLDINLNGETSAAIAAALNDLSVPFILTSGYNDFPADPAFQGKPLVKKPISMADLVGNLTRILD